MSDVSKYPERKIERKGKDVSCQILYSKEMPWVCYDINKSEKFLADNRMGTMMEIDLHTFIHNNSNTIQAMQAKIDEQQRVIDSMTDALEDIVEHGVSQPIALNMPEERWAWRCFNNLQYIAREALTQAQKEG